MTAVMIFDTDLDVVLSLALLRCRSFVVLCAQEISSLNAGSLTHDKLRKLWRAVCSFATKQLSQNRVHCLHHKHTLCCLAGSSYRGPSHIVFGILASTTTTTTRLPMYLSLDASRRAQMATHVL